MQVRHLGRCFGALTAAATLAGFHAVTPAVFGAGADQAAQSLPSTPQRLAEMRHHFADVTLVQEAVIRGDLAAVRVPASRLAKLATPPEIPPTAGRFLVAISVAARRAVDAKTLATAAMATTSMLRQCGECHVAVKVMPAPSVTSRPDVGGIVGHMLEHQRASDELVQGLVVPSPARWQQGAERLQVAALVRSDLPSDRALTPEIRAAEVEVHNIGVRAASARTPAARAETYAELLTVCASCHSLHSRIWGPATR